LFQDLTDVAQTGGTDKWKQRVDGLLNNTDVFFQDGVMFEVACEGNGKCNIDQMSFKAYLARWMAATTKMAPWTFDAVMARLRPSALAAAAQCNGGDTGRTCGLIWTNNGTWDGTNGVGQQMSAMEVIQSNLIAQVKPPLTNTTGGTSKGDPNAGVGTGQMAIEGWTVTTGDKVGAAFLTTFVLIGFIGGALWISL
jgi:mannan endo-1,6-alpha-mannosidase